MKLSILITIASVLLCMSCACRPGPQGERGGLGAPGSAGPSGSAGSSCSVNIVPQGALILCTDGTSALIENGADGERGENGNDGANGQDGYSTVFSVVDAGASCPVGGSIILLATDANRSGTLDGLDTGLQSALVCNGVDGQNGADGADGQDGADAPATAFTPVGIHDPCGDKPGVYDEVFLQLANGQYLASFSDNTSGLNTRFAVLVPGNFVTSDGSACYFTVDNLGAITNEHY